MKPSIDRILDAIADRAKPGQRFIAAIVGAPGAGKSTIAQALCEALNSVEQHTAAVLPMDGFHLDNAILDTRALRETKGAPGTFDADGFAATLARIRSGDQDVIVPVFDRDMDLARAGGRQIDKGTRVIIVEGNYLLLNRPEWAQSAGNYDLTIFLDVPKIVLKERLVRRWLDQGFDIDAATARACGNDLGNGDTVIGQSRPADIRLSMAIE